MTKGQQSQSAKINRAERLERILSSIRLNTTIRLSALADEFDVSSETIRRDLERLHSQGLISRTYGGAISYSPGHDPSFSERMETNAPARDAVAREAVKLVRRGDVIFISSGVTSLQFAQHLATHAEEITAITTSVHVANALAALKSSRTILAPGDFDTVEQAVSGPETRAFIEKFHGSRVFFGVSGLTEEGPNESRSAIAWNLRAMIARSEQVVVLADHTKFGEKHMELISDLSSIDVLVTDLSPENSLREAIDGAAIELQVTSA